MIRIAKMVCLFLVVALLQVGAVAAPLAGPTSRVSVTNSGGAGNRDSFFADVSANGRYVTFASEASNLVNNDTNGVADIFVRDREANSTERVSVRSDGEQANAASYSPSISDDGRYVAFHSFATNLFENDTNNVPDIFVYDRQEDELLRVSYVVGGVANNVSYEGDISGNGRYVTFWSYASNLVANDTNGEADIFRFDIQALTMERISVDSNEVQANGESRSPSISDDGNVIAFESDASNLVTVDGNGYTDIFVRNVSAGTTIRVSRPNGGGEGIGDSTRASLSGDGNNVAFESLADNLVPNDTNNYQDIFVYNIILAGIARANLPANNTQANASSYAPAISDNGRFLAFSSQATNLVSGDLGDIEDVFLKDRQTGVLLRASINSDGIVGNNRSLEPALTDDGRYVVFTSFANNLIPSDGNGNRDIFIHDRKTPPAISQDYYTGKPGSHFIFSGEGFAESQTVQVSINGDPLGTVNTDASGNFIFRMITNNGTQQGTYLVALQQGDLLFYASFLLDNDAPLRAGAGAGLGVPSGIALTEHIYMPIMRD